MRQPLKIAKNHLVSQAYEMDDGWHMLILVTSEEAEDHTWHPYAEAWVKHEHCGIMSLMYGCDLEENHETLDQFIETAYYNFDDYKEDFLEDKDILETITELHWRMK